MKEVTIYTDGAFSGNPGLGGWAEEDSEWEVTHYGYCNEFTTTGKTPVEAIQKAIEELKKLIEEEKRYLKEYSLYG